jgi:hypothetical protein
MWGGGGMAAYVTKTRQAAIAIVRSLSELLSQSLCLSGLLLKDVAAPGMGKEERDRC